MLQVITSAAMNSISAATTAHAVLSRYTARTNAGSMGPPFPGRTNHGPQRGPCRLRSSWSLYREQRVEQVLPRGRLQREFLPRGVLGERNPLVVLGLGHLADLRAGLLVFLFHVADRL